MRQTIFALITAYIHLYLNVALYIVEGIRIISLEILFFD